MPAPVIAHFLGDAVDSARLWVWIVAIAGAFALLTLWHREVKSGRTSTRYVLICAVVIATFAATTPFSGATQPGEGSPGLPDLISDRPFIWREQIEVDETTGAVTRVLAFDGYLHNVGEGSLDLFGNPQITGDVVQRTFDGEDWQEVDAPNPPTVRYETNDGHNHFHLIGVSDYALFSESRNAKATDSAKVGFCLVDTEQMEEATESFYDIDRYRYCNQDDPESTELRMGISPGWRDTYDANTTLQWVDVSAVTPGRYWIGAITDPRNEIVESNEENNGLTFSLNTFPVSGYAPLPSPPATINGAPAPLKLQVQAFGLVGAPTWTITTAPTHGVLDVPIGAAFTSGIVHYTPDEGFEGSDSFSWQVRDSTRTFPTSLETADQQIVVATSTAGKQQAASLPPQITSTASSFVAAEYGSFEAQFDATSPAGNEIRWFSIDLPPGLLIDEMTGTVTGSPTTRGSYTATIVAWDGYDRADHSVTWTIEPEQEAPPLRTITTQQSPVNERVDVFLGRQLPNAAYTATGLPDGVLVVPNIPWISGTPTTVGTYDITVTETIDGEIAGMTSFTWTVRPIAAPAFPL